MRMYDVTRARARGDRRLGVCMDCTDYHAEYNTRLRVPRTGLSRWVTFASTARLPSYADLGKGKN